MNKFCEKARNVMIAANTLYIGTVLSIVPAFAADEGGDLGVWSGAATSIENMMKTLQNALLKIANPIAGAALVFCLIMTLVSQNQRTVETYKGWIKNIIVCLVAINAVGFIISIATNLGKQFQISG